MLGWAASHLMRLFRVLAVVSFSLLLSSLTTRAVPTTNGLYAAFVTSQGTFYCLLHYDLAPRTTANFVSLADGTKDWMNYTNGKVVKQPFFNGLKFFRVVS